MSNYWLNQNEEKCQFDFNFVPLEIPKLIHFPECKPSDPAISFIAENKTIMWIDYAGKLHVDPDAPADETAKKVCDILLKNFKLISASL